MRSRTKHNEPNTNESNKHTRLLVVQPRFRPDSLLKTKLDEALNLANSLEQQRDGIYDTHFEDKELPPHIVVQNPAYRVTRAGLTFIWSNVVNLTCELCVFLLCIFLWELVFCVWWVILCNGYFLVFEMML